MFLWKYFVHRASHYAVQDRNGKYWKVTENITLPTLLKHVRGEITIGTYQICPDTDTVKWIVYDIDDHDNVGDTDIDLYVLTKRLRERNVPFIDELSGSLGSHHLWVLLKVPVKTAMAFQWAHEMVIDDSGFMIVDCEVFPKQETVNPEKPYGNLVKLPLGLNRRCNRFSFFDSLQNGNVETIDLTGYVPSGVQLRTFTKGSKSNCDQNVEGGSVVSVYSGVRPCINAILDQKVQLVHYHGHKLRIAVSSEILNVTDLSNTEVAKLFRFQSDYEFGKSLYYVESVNGYHRPKCETIRRHCKGLNCLDIMSICEKCTLRS